MDNTSLKIVLQPRSSVEHPSIKVEVGVHASTLTLDLL